MFYEDPKPQEPGDLGGTEGTQRGPGGELRPWGPGALQRGSILGNPGPCCVPKGTPGDPRYTEGLQWGLLHTYKGDTWGPGGRGGTETWTHPGGPEVMGTRGGCDGDMSRGGAKAMLHHEGDTRGSGTRSGPIEDGSCGSPEAVGPRRGSDGAASRGGGAQHRGSASQGTPRGHAGITHGGGAARYRRIQTPQRWGRRVRGRFRR